MCPCFVKTLGHTSVCPAGFSSPGPISAPAKLRGNRNGPDLPLRQSMNQEAGGGKIHHGAPKLLEIVRVMFIGTQVDTISCKGADSVCCPLLAFFLCFFIMREARIPHSGAAQCAAAPRPAPSRCPPCRCRGTRCGCSGGSCGSISPSARPLLSAG